MTKVYTSGEFDLVRSTSDQAFLQLAIMWNGNLLKQSEMISTTEQYNATLNEYKLACDQCHQSRLLLLELDPPETKKDASKDSD